MERSQEIGEQAQMKMGMPRLSFTLVLLAGFLLSGCATGNYRAPVEDASHGGGGSSSEPDSDASAQSQEGEESGVQVFAYSQPQQGATSPAPAQMESSSSYGANASDRQVPSESAPESNYGPSSAASESAPNATGENLYGPASSDPEPSSSSKYSFSAPTEGSGANAPAASEASQYAAPADASPGFQDDPGVKADQSTPVASLLALADTQVSGGDFALAAASLERALRIEPKNAILWHELAKVRLDQSQWGETESLALKSNSLAAGGQSRLVASNWRMIAEARRRNGNPQGAAEADAQANKAE